MDKNTERQNPMTPNLSGDEIGRAMSRNGVRRGSPLEADIRARAYSIWGSGSGVDATDARSRDRKMDTYIAERKGTPAVRRINRRINALLPDRVKVFGVEVNEKLPEKLAVKGLQLVKVQARREDVVGDVAKRTLRIFNGSFKTIARTATRLEQASELTPRRPAESKPAARRARGRSARRRAA